MSRFSNDFLRIMTSLVVSMFGGLVRLIKSSDNISFIKILKELLISGFAGLMVYYLLKDVTYVTENFKIFLIGMSGYSGPAILDSMEKILFKFCKLFENGIKK